MTKGKELEIVPKDGEAIGSSVEEFGTKNFYNPLSLTGYLTPLQRKKLREKRNISGDLNYLPAEKVKKPKNVKRKRENVPNVRDQSKERIKRVKTKDVQRLEFTVSKILHVQNSDSNKTKKFFKSSSSDRLAKANFSMPLVMKKNAFANRDKNVRQKAANSKKLVSEENVTLDNASEVFESIENLDNFDTETNQNCSYLEKPILHIIRREDMVQKPLVAEVENGFEFDWPSDDELIKRQEKARLLSREKKVLKDLSNINREQDIETAKQSAESVERKLYPIFHAAIKRQQLDSVKRSQKHLVKKVKDSKSGGEQLIIDAGQKEFGAKMCATCNMIYSVGVEEDERLHLDYHNMYLVNLKFLGWKEENVIGEYCDGRVILVRKTDKSFMIKKVEEVLQVANRDLGFPSSAMPAASDLTFILFISKDKQVAGCIVAEPISKAFPVVSGGDGPEKDPCGKAVWRIGNWYSSSKAVPAVCGVNRIWVAHNYRRQRIASRMIDCLRCHFIHGHVIGIRELAFTDPSPDGRDFAASYTKTDFFLVYK